MMLTAKRDKGFCVSGHKFLSTYGIVERPFNERSLPLSQLSRVSQVAPSRGRALCFLPPCEPAKSTSREESPMSQKVEYPSFTAYSCITSNCDNAPKSYDRCYICKETLGRGALVIHFFQDTGQGLENRRLFGNLCEDCSELVRTDGFRQELHDKRTEFRSSQEYAETQMRDLIVQLQALKQTMEFLESEINDRERTRNFYRDSGMDVLNLLNPKVPFYFVSQEEARAINSAHQQAAKQPVKSLPPAQTPVKRKGFVYLIGSEQGHFKIGRTKDVPSRFNTLSIQLPFKIELLHSIEVEDCIRAEAFLHEKFSDKRLNGEWFSLEEIDIEWIKAQAILEGLY